MRGVGEAGFNVEGDGAMRKRMVEICKGVYRDPDLEVVRASDGKRTRYKESV